MKKEVPYMIRIAVEGKSEVWKERALIAFDCATAKVVAIGEEASVYLPGKTGEGMPKEIIAVCPFFQGYISDYTVAEKLIKYCLYTALAKKSMFKPNVILCLEKSQRYTVNLVSLKAYEDALYQAGSGNVAVVTGEFEDVRRRMLEIEQAGRKYQPMDDTDKAFTNKQLFSKNVLISITPEDTFDYLVEGWQLVEQLAEVNGYSTKSLMENE